MADLILDEMKLPLRLDMVAYEAIEREYGSYDKMEALRKDPETKINTLLTVAAIMANSAAIREGREERYTREWLASRVQLFELTMLEPTINATIAESFRMVKKKTGETGTTTSSSRSSKERKIGRWRRGRSTPAV